MKVLAYLCSEKKKSDSLVISQGTKAEQDLLRVIWECSWKGRGTYWRHFRSLLPAFPRKLIKFLYHKKQSTSEYRHTVCCEIMGVPWGRDGDTKGCSLRGKPSTLNCNILRKSWTLYWGDLSSYLLSTLPIRSGQGSTNPPTWYKLILLRKANFSTANIALSQPLMKTGDLWRAPTAWGWYLFTAISRVSPDN